MLKLKRVEIHGFKSFYDRTEMKFSGSGIAAVVGPNGCGKSNLSDAICWVLGEQSAKSLRGARMEDVIFAGTRDRKALGMASVTLTLVPDEKTLAGSRLRTQPAESENEQTNTLDVAVEATDSHSFQNCYNNEAMIGEPSLDKLSDSGESDRRNGFARPPSEAARAADRAGEITITRRLYRSGESEYLINGKQARLRDIQDLFLGTGLGPESYAIIEQGRIGQILSNRPQDRRNLIEEAAGITKFRTRKRLAETKLESAKQNLARVFDILEEVTRQANSLKRQAAKTRRYSELKGEATGYLEQLLAAKFRMLEREMAKVTIELNLAATELQDFNRAIQAQETARAKVLETLYSVDSELTEARQQLANRMIEAERTRGRLEYQSKQIAQITEALDSGEQELERLGGQQSDRAKELEAQTAELAELDRDCRAAAQGLTAKTSERQAVQERLAAEERELEARRQNVLKLLGESASLRNRITQVEAQLASVERDLERARSEEQQSRSEISRIQQAKAELSAQLAVRQTDLVSLEEQRKAIEGELQRRRAELGEGRAALDSLKSEASRVRARKDSLEEVIQHRSYTTETVKRLFTAVERANIEGFEPMGVLADFLEVAEPQFEKAAEEFLHDELEYVVVRNWMEGERGIELMRGDLNGRGTFLVEDPGTQSEPAAEVAHPRAEPGTLTRLSDVLRWTNGLSHIPLAQLPRIANCYIANERALARELSTRFPHCWFLTTDGVNYHGQAVSGGNKTGAGPLALKRELREICKLDEAKQAELGAAHNRFAELERTIAGLSEELDRLRSRQQIQEKDILALDHESRKLAEELVRLESRLSHAGLELDRMARERVSLEENAVKDRQALVEREQTRIQEEQLLAGAREQLAAQQAELARITEEHAGLRANQASLEERRRSFSSNYSRLQTQLQEVIERRAYLVRETERMGDEKAQLIANNTELQARTGELTIAIGEGEREVNRLAQREAELRAELATAEDELKRLRAAAQVLHEQRSERQVALARAESQCKHLEESCRQELNTTLADLTQRSEEMPDEAALENLESKYAEVRRKIDALGPVNPQALDEFQEAQQRQEFLSAQRQDLLDSIRDTQKAITEIDSESRKRFGEAFHAINANFKKMFADLFGGGTGEMRLTDENDLAESGIDIVASPPGKRLQSVLLLSGGEKSLTAMALLMSIFQYTPSPFCILDEVDAPLDEPNIERLTTLLQQMAQQTQFIVITHAKRTMEAAQSLYGVTMQEAGISKLVSVRFQFPEGVDSRKDSVNEEQIATAAR